MKEKMRKNIKSEYFQLLNIVVVFASRQCLLKRDSILRIIGMRISNKLYFIASSIPRHGTQDSGFSISCFICFACRKFSL